MENRVNKYYSSDLLNSSEQSITTRSSRNAKLYKHIYGKYEDLDNLPIEDNTNEIDMEKLRELVLSNTSKEEEQIKENLNILEQRKRRIDEQKVYDINKILEKAKYENNKLKENTREENSPRRDLLSTLGSSELSLSDIEKARREYQEQIEKVKKEEKQQEELSMTRELKYKNLNQEVEKEDGLEDKSLFGTDGLSLDLFAELKPTGNTIITKPIDSDLNKPLNNTNKIDTSHIKSDIHSGDTRDIDIIKDGPTTTADDFFTNVYEFSKKDFADAEDEDFFDPPKKGGIFKIILLILAIIAFVGVIIYFVGTYGMGLS